MLWQLQEKAIKTVNYLCRCPYVCSCVCVSLCELSLFAWTIEVVSFCWAKVSYGFDFKARYKYTLTHTNKHTYVVLHFQNGEQLNVIFRVRNDRKKFSKKKKQFLNMDKRDIFNFINAYGLFSKFLNLPASAIPCISREGISRHHNVKYFIQNISDFAKVWFLTSSHIIIQFCGCLGVEWKKKKRNKTGVAGRRSVSNEIFKLTHDRTLRLV